MNDDTSNTPEERDVVAENKAASASRREAAKTPPLTAGEMLQRFAAVAGERQHGASSAQQYRKAAVLALDAGDPDDAAVFAQLAISAAIEEAGHGDDG